MSTFQTTCPSCQRLLELPREAIGRSARCPACQHTFTASGNQAAETQAHETPAPGDLALNGPTTSAPLPSIEPSPFVSGPDSPDAGFPRSGTENPYVNPISGGAAAMGGANPYQPSGHIPNTPRFSGTVAPGEMVVCTSTFDSVWATAFSIYKDRWGRLLGAMAIVMAISLGVFAVTGVLGAVLGGNNQGVATFLAIASNLISQMISMYFSVGIARNAIAVARNEPEPLGHLFPPIIAVFRYLGGMILLFSLMGVIAVVLFGASYVIGQVAGSEEIGFVLMILSGVTVAGLFFSVFWFFWSFPSIVADGRATLTEAISTSKAITMKNKGTSLLILVVSSALVMVGMMACYIGIFATMPLMWTMISVAYLKMTSQPVSDPEYRGY